jgi:hypothetical protein
MEHVNVVIFYTMEERGLIQLQVMAGLVKKPDLVDPKPKP